MILKSWHFSRPDQRAPGWISDVRFDVVLRVYTESARNDSGVVESRTIRARAELKPPMISEDPAIDAPTVASNVRQFSLT